jgi:hypothetical protein
VESVGKCGKCREDGGRKEGKPWNVDEGWAESVR